MPKNANLTEPPDLGTTAAVVNAVQGLGIPAIRSAILRVLALHPDGRTSGQIQRALGSTYQTTFRHLRELEHAGLVRVYDVTEKPDGSRAGQRVMYQLDGEARDRQLEQLRAYLSGE